MAAFEQICQLTGMLLHKIVVVMYYAFADVVKARFYVACHFYARVF